MQTNATSAAVEHHPLVFAGFPASSWVFAVRVWLAIMVALYASFWLELEAPSSAAITVAILAFPTRGQGIEKAGFRLFATVIGVAASIAIAGAFSQTDGLLLTVFAVWTGLCVYAAAMLDGNRAYAAALCCTTVALIAVQQIDSPQLVFETGVARGAAIAVGVLATALVNDILALPDYHPVISARLEALHRQVVGYADDALRGETTSITAAGGLLRDIAAMRPEMASLATESGSGPARSTAARNAMVELVTELLLARALSLVLLVAPSYNSEVHGSSRVAPSTLSSSDRDDSSSGLIAVCIAWLREELLRRDGDVGQSLDALRAGTKPSRKWRSPLYRSQRIAAETGVRAAIHFALASIVFVATGWPTTELCLSLVAIIIALGTTAPDARAFTAIAVLITPVACLLAGILKYLVLDGVSEFQLLAIALAPLVIGSALLIALPNRIFSPVGRLTLVFTFAILAPTNPQTYDPLTFLVTSLFVCLSTILAFGTQILVPPLSNDRRAQQLLKEAHRELTSLDVQRDHDLAPEEAAFHDAGRIEQIVKATGVSGSISQTLHEAMCCFDQATALRLCNAELDKIERGPLAGAADAARISLAQRDGSAIWASAKFLRQTAFQHGVSADPACAALVLASVVFTKATSATGAVERGAL